MIGRPWVIDRAPIGPNRKCALGRSTDLEMSDHESNEDHEDSSDASSSSGDIDCEIVDDSSRDEEIDEQLHEEECLGPRSSDPSSQSLPPLSRKEPGSSKEISSLF